MRRAASVVGLCAAALVMAAVAPAAADARVETITLRSRPFVLNGFQTIVPKVKAATPRRSGYITHMDAWLVDGRGRRMSIRNVMLHHIVFLNYGRPGGPAKRSSCRGRNGEPFWGTGEENQPLLLPPGYGYRIAARERWRMQAMLMSHDLAAHRVRVVYSMRVVTGTRLERVKPLWLRATGCTKHPSYDIMGDQPPGSIDATSYEWKIPISGRIVSSGAHLHGSSYGLTITQPRCAGRTLVDQKPLYGRPDDLVYRARPLLHEPGPIATGHFLSATGIPVRRGEMLRVTGLYDATRPHAGVMAITHVYIAPDRGTPRSCDPLPADAQIVWSRKDGRTEPPVVDLPLNGLGSDGKVHEIERPVGDEQLGPAPRSVVSLKGGRFLPANLSVARGTEVLWRFTDRTIHNITLASGPRLVVSASYGKGSSYAQTLDTPGTYKLFCYLHPITMTQVVTVRPDPEEPAEQVRP